MKFNTKDIYSYLLLGFPFLIFSFLSVFYFNDTRELIKEVIAFLLLNLIFFCLAFQFSNNKIKKVLISFLIIFISLISFIKLGFVHLYNTKITGSALFVIFETNKSEAGEYLKTYLNKDLFLLLFLHCIPIILIFRAFFLIKKGDDFNFKLSVKARLLLVLIMVFSIYQIQKRFYNQDIFFRIFNSYEGYTKYQEGLSNKLSIKKPTVEDGVCTKNLQPQTHIVIIGESLTRNHMSLYGYPRKTNPELEKIKDELLVFRKVISPHVHTTTSLEKILTLAEFSNPDPKDNMSIVQMANMADYTTFWISNQEPIGLTETIPTIIGNAAHSKYWLETENFYAKIHDGKLLPQLKQVLEKPNKRKVVFLHLMGVHGTYNKRYPEEFDYYSDMPPKIISKKDRAIKYTNYYDNAVRYNDYIVKEIISLVKQKNINSSVTYFSDHGQEVFDTIDFMGHNEYNSTKPMYEIPFLLWFSEKYKEYYSVDIETLRKYKNRKYQLENFPHVFAKLTGIYFEGVEKKKNILDEGFVEEDRIIKNGVNYDD